MSCASKNPGIAWTSGTAGCRGQHVSLLGCGFSSTPSSAFLTGFSLQFHMGTNDCQSSSLMLSQVQDY